MTNHQQQQQLLLSDLEYKSNDVGHLLDFFSDVVDEGEGEGGDEVGKPLEQNTVDDESMVVEPTTTTTPATTTQATTASSSFEESVESTRTDATEAPVVVVVEPEPTSTAALPQEKELVETSTKEKEVAISIYSTSHPCANDGTATATADDSEENGMMEQLVQFDYDLVLSSSTFAVEQSSNDINSILQQLEEQLLDHVGVALEGVGLCGSGSSSSGGGVRRTSDRKMLRRRRRSLLAADENDEGVTILEEISSLPMDDVLANATCSKENLPTSSSTTTSTTACYPISGYMTAYYYNIISDTATESSTTSRADDIIEMAIYDIIQRSMTESTITNDLTATNNNGDTLIANVHFVGVRGSSLEEQQLGNPSSSNNGMIFNPNTKPQPSSSSSSSSTSSNGMLIGIIIGGLLAVVAVFMLAFVAVRRSRATHDNHDDDYDDDLRSHDGTSQDEDAERAGEITMHLPPTSMIVSSSRYNNNAGVPSYNESNDAYHRREEEQQRQRQQHQWLSRSLTSETDMTPVVSNVKRSRRHQRQQQQRHVAEQTIQECGGDGESEW